MRPRHTLRPVHKKSDTLKRGRFYCQSGQATLSAVLAELVGRILRAASFKSVFTSKVFFVVIAHV